MARGTVVGAELSRTPWVGEAARVLLNGRRLVVESEQPTVPESVKQLAAGQGLWVGERR
jgi:hypothetical protein